MTQNVIHVVEHENGTFDFQIRAAENNNLLCSSDQGYEHLTECISMAHRVQDGPYAVNIALNFREDS